MNKKVKILLITLIAIIISICSFYIYFINIQSKNGSILIEKGSLQDFLIFDKTGMTYYDPVTKKFIKQN